MKVEIGNQQQINELLDQGYLVPINYKNIDLSNIFLEVPDSGVPLLNISEFLMAT